MKNVIRVNPRARTPVLEKCPHCGSPDIELRPDGAYLCGKCYYTSKPRVNASLLQSWSGSIFNLGRAGPPPEDLAKGGRIAIAGGLLFLAAVGIALGPFAFSGLLGRLLDPPPPAGLPEVAATGGVLLVGLLGLLAGFTGYTMSRGDPKAWRVTLPVGLVGLVLGIVGPGGAVGALAGIVAAAGGWIGRHGDE